MLHPSFRGLLLAGTITAWLAGCAMERATQPLEAGIGPSPTLPRPNPTMIPTVKIAKVVGWPAGQTPQAAPGLEVSEYAGGLDHPRWLHVLPNGDVLVAETNAPPRPQEGRGFRGWVMGLMMRQAGASAPSANRITLLRDTDGDGRADERHAFLQGLNSPFGMALVGDVLYVANTDAVVRFPYQEGAVAVREPAVPVAALPAGDLNHHWTKNIIASADGARLYATVGSNSNVGENGLANEENRAAILEIELATGATRLFASGLRNPNGLAWQPRTGNLWTVVNERDEIGSDLVPDYLTEVVQGAFYGWPWSYYGAHVDERVEPRQPEKVASARVPDYALGAHTASLGLAFYEGELLGGRFAEGALIGQHGSWNRDPPAGYRVIFVPFADGKPRGMPEEVLTGFLDAQGNALGRPVGVVVDRQGAVLVADDVGNRIWRVVPGG